MRIFNSTPRDDNFRMPGEFERHQGCIMIWPVRPGSWIYGGKAAKKVFAKIAAIIAQSEYVYMLADHEHLKEAHEHLKEAQEQKNPKDTEADFSETRQYKEVHHMLERQVTCEGKGIEVVELESDDAWARDVAPTFVKNADGSFSETTMDQLINREENSTSDGLVIDTISTTNRKTEVILVLKKAISNVNNITVRYSDKMIFKKDETSDLLMKH